MYLVPSLILVGIFCPKQYNSVYLDMKFFFPDIIAVIEIISI